MIVSTVGKSRGGSGFHVIYGTSRKDAAGTLRKGLHIQGGYKPKSEAQLKWNAIKKAAIARATLEAAIYRERLLDKYLSELWPEFEKSLQKGELLELEIGSFDDLETS